MNDNSCKINTIGGSLLLSLIFCGRMNNSIKVVDIGRKGIKYDINLVKYELPPISYSIFCGGMTPYSQNDTFSVLISPQKSKILQNIKIDGNGSFTNSSFLNSMTDSTIILSHRSNKSMLYLEYDYKSEEPNLKLSLSKIENSKLQSKYYKCE